MLSIFLSNILGLVRLRLLSHFFGASAELGVFLAADRLPSFIFNLTVIGALSSSFIPVFTRYLISGNRVGAFRFSSAVINTALLVFGFLSLVLYVFAPQVSFILSLGRLTAEELSLMVSLTRILLIPQFFLTLSIFATSILQSFDYFAAPAVAPIFYNLGSVVGVIFLTPFLGIHGAAWGAVFGSILHLAIQLPFLTNLGFRYLPNFDLSQKPVVEVFSLMIPRTLALAADQVNLLVDTSLSLSLSASSVVVLSFAQRLQYLPVILFGSTISQAVLPTLSRLASAGSVSREEFKRTLAVSFHQMLYLILPVSIIFFILRLPLVRLAFGTRRFDWFATNLTGYTLAFFSLGIFAQSVASLLTRAFFAFKDTQTPLKTVTFSVLLNVSLSIFFVKIMGFNVWSLALSSSVASLANATLLFFYLERKIGGFDLVPLLDPVIKMAFSGLVMGIFIYLPLKLLDRGGWGSLFPFTFGALLLDTRYTINLIFLTLLSTFLGLCYYLVLTSYLKVSEGRSIVLRLKSFGKYFFPTIFPE